MIAAVVFPAEGGRPLYAPTAQIAWQMGEIAGYNLFAHLEGKKLDKFSAVSILVHLLASDVKMVLLQLEETTLHLKVLPATLMKEASNIRYLSHIKALYALAY